MLFNLLSNAIKFTPEDGRIDVAAASRGEELVVSVTDTGIGVQSFELERVFDAFYQIKRRGPVKEQGSGLGLSLSRKLVELHGKDVGRERGEGKGSRSRSPFPCIRGRHSRKINTSTVPFPGGKP